MSFAPPVVVELLRELFSDLSTPSHAQVATVTPEGEPSVRTVFLRYLEVMNTFGFGTHVDSPKWSDLSHRPLLAGCWYVPARPLQLRWSGNVTLIHARSEKPEEVAARALLWQLDPPELRADYRHDAGLGGDTTEPSDNFGAVICVPGIWDVFVIDPAHYSRSRRTRYWLRDSQWHVEDVTPLK